MGERCPLAGGSIVASLFGSNEIDAARKVNTSLLHTHYLSVK